MKAIIPVAGAGTKLRPLTYTQPKPLIPVAGKPIIAFIIDKLIAAGINDFVFVIGYLGEKMKAYLDEYYPQIKKEYVVQGEREGLGHAIYTCKPYINGDNQVLIQLGDTILDIDLHVLMHSKYSTLAVQKVNDPRSFGVVELDENLHVKRLIEKPVIPKSNLAIAGLYFIKEFNKLFEALEYNIQHEIKTRGEYHLTDGLMRMIETGTRVEVMEVKNWFDCGKKEVLLETNAILLDRQLNTIAQPSMEGSIIIPPVHIGKNCKINHSIIGPHVTIGDNSQIDNTILKDAIVGNYTILEDIVLQHSIIGNDAVVRGRYQSYNIGDNTEIDMI
ncbi:MAG: sugar phosphate nucleotidyltransferase [Bacteroidota bacterium]|nr:sugar phosphate nucleotidyltransferase [Bacteroidota bacterium]